MKIAKLDRWAMLLQEYDITFVHIRGKDNILANAVSMLCTINVYDDAVEDKQQHSLDTQGTTHSSKVTVDIQLFDSGTPPQLLNITTAILQNLQKQDKFCKNKVCKLHPGMKDNFYLNNDSILKQKVVVNNLEITAIVIPTPLIYTLLHEFHNCKGHQGSTRTFQPPKKKILVERNEERCKEPHQQLHHMF